MARSIVCVNELRIAIDGRERTRDNDEHIIGESDQGQTAQSENVASPCNASPIVACGTCYACFNAAGPSAAVEARIICGRR